MRSGTKQRADSAPAPCRSAWESLVTAPGGVCHTCTSRPRPFRIPRMLETWSLEAFLCAAADARRLMSQNTTLNLTHVTHQRRKLCSQKVVTDRYRMSRRRITSLGGSKIRTRSGAFHRYELRASLSAATAAQLKEDFDSVAGRCDPRLSAFDRPSALSTRISVLPFPQYH
jgi:hypothetical protein